MITIATNDVRKFIQRSRAVKDNNIMKILDYIKLECAGGKATMSKTNLSLSCIQAMPVQGEDVTLLLDEKILSNLAGNTRAEFLTIDVAGADIFISDGKTRLSFAVEKPELFPPLATWDESQEWSELDENVLSAITIARKHTASTGDTAYSFVHITQRGADVSEVFATNGPVTYIKSFPQQLPTLILSVEACAAIGDLFSCRHQAIGNQDVFNIGDTTYCFVRQEHGTPDYGRIAGSIKKEGGFTAELADLIRFCDITLGSTISPLPFCELTDVDGPVSTIHLSYDDPNLRISNKLDIDVEKAGVISPFYFNAKSVQPALKALPYKRISMASVVGGRAYAAWTSEDESYLGLFMAIQKPA